MYVFILIVQLYQNRFLSETQQTFSLKCLIYSEQLTHCIMYVFMGVYIFLYI